MKTPSELMREMYGNYLTSFTGKRTTKRVTSKHQASKRGHKHNRRPSRGEAKDAKTAKK
jgi:hypothetical protein